MGDRANVYVPGDDKGGVYLYTHWSGHNLPIVVKKALAKRWRWDDPPYLTRIIFDKMTDGRHGEETGFGISTRICDNNGYPIVRVDCSRTQVSFVSAQSKEMLYHWSFEEFIKLSDKEIRAHYGPH